jgi:hypothetical protein
MGFDKRSIMAANNNADLYEAMFASRGLHYTRLPYAFIGKDRPPPYYSNLTVLAPDNTGEIVRRLGTLARQFDGAIGVKDSFCELELQDHGFSELFRATWMWRAAGVPSTLQGWRLIEDSSDLKLWEAAWKECGSPTNSLMFEDAMLRWPNIYFFGRKGRNRFEAGCIANRSGDCIGISNVYSRSSPKDAFAEATASAASIDRKLPIVGYEAGSALQDALLLGFEPVGDLRILVAEAAAF